MSNQISTFNFNSNPVRVELIQNEPFFCLSDVCDILGLNRRSTEAFRLNEKGCNNITTLTKGGKQELTFINEPNLYRIIFKSRKTEAVEFQNWVFEEVLPQIRKTGQYSQNQQQNLPLVKNEIEVVEPTLTPKQQHQIQELVQGVHVHTEMSYAEIYSKLKNKFKVAKYDQIPQSRYREAIKYLGRLPMMDMPKQVTFSMFEVLPLAIMLGHLRTLMVDFNIIHSQLKTKDDTLAKMLNNHYQQFNADTPLFHRVQSAIARLIDSLPEKEREFAFDMVYKI